MSEAAKPESHSGDSLYRQVVDLSPDCIWVHQASLILIANAPAARTFGFGTPQAMIGRPILDLVHPDDRHRAMLHTDGIVEHGKPMPPAEMRFLRADGRSIAMEIQATPFWHEGKPAMLAVGRNISGRSEAAGSLRESEARFRSLANSLPALMWMSDEKGDCVFVNDSWLAYTGRSLSEELVHGYADNIHPDHRTGAIALEQKFFPGRQPIHSEYPLKGKDGGYRWFVDYSVPRFSDDGRYLGHLGVLIDVDERRRLEAKMRAIVESTVDGIVTVTDDGIVRTFSASAERIFGYKAEEIVGRNVSLLMPDPDRSRHDGYIKNYLTTGVAKIIGIGREARGRRKDGSVFPIDLAVGELSSIGGQREFVGTIRDISERRRLEDQLRQSQKMEAIGQLTGGIAHDFNNLLGVVIGNLDMVLEDLDGQSGQAQAASRALNGALHGAELTHRLLAFARRLPLEPKVLSINDMLPDVVALLKRTLGESISVRAETDPGLWPAFADPSQLQDAVLNLALNARDAMPAGGRLTIETANVQLDEDYARDNPDAKPGDFAMLAVTDNGTGIPPDLLKRVLEPFFTTKPAGKGTGLGLSMIYGFAKQSGGHLKIYSEVGHGTTVKLYLPRAKVAAVEAPKSAEEPKQLPRGSETILIAEDNPDLRSTAAGQLARLGYRVLEAKDGETALRLLQGPERIDLLFSDIVMTGKLTGNDLLREARRLRPDLPVLLTTGYAERMTTEGGKNDWQFLRKPYRKKDLAFKVRAMLDER